MKDREDEFTLQHRTSGLGSSTGFHQNRYYQTDQKPTQDSNRNSSSQLSGAPLPAPLHIIEAFASRSTDDEPKLKLSTPEWNVSELSSIDIMQSSSVAVAEADEIGYQEHRLIEREPHRKLNAVTESWAASSFDPPTVELLTHTRNPADDQCDIDTCKGTILPSVEYPETYKTQTGGPCHDMRDFNWRQDNMTSELWILREIRKRKVIAENIRTKFEEAQLQLVVAGEESWPAADCLLRPATPEDFQGIAAMMNLERSQDLPNILEAAPVSPSDIKKIYENCQRGLRPFIVAVPTNTEFLDRSKWPKGADKEYEEFVKFKLSQNKDIKTIVGFAFVSNARNGIFGTPCYGSRFAGRITLLVHPGYRQKSYGSALLDRTLLSVAAYHRSLIDYKWDCPNPARVYEHSVAKNQRKYARLYIETLVDSAHESKDSWVDKMLEKFEFEKVGRLDKAVRLGTEHKKTWLDVVLWEFHARPIDEITDDDCRR